MKRALALLLLPLICVCCSGCLGAVQADDYIYVVGIGVDEGTRQRFNVSFLVQKDVSGTDGNQTGGAEVISAEADTLFDAVTTLNAGLPFSMSFARVNTVFFGEETAKNGSIKELSSITFNALKIRQSVKLMVCLGTAQRFMQGMCIKEMPNITKLQFSIFQDYASEGITVITNYARMMESIRGQRSDPVMMLGGVDTNAVQSQKALEKELTDGETQDGESGGAVSRLGGMSSYAAGTALFDGWQMKGALSCQDTKLLLIGRGELKKCSIKLKNGDSWTVLYLKDERPPSVRLTLGERPRAEIAVELSCNIAKHKGRALPEEWESGLRLRAEQLVAEEMTRVFEKCRELNCDAFALGEYASMQFSDTKSWEEYRWKEKYPLTEAVFSVKLEIADENATTRLE